jgi:hypothetical protein
MKILLITLLSIVFIKESKAQTNLVPNPSFEDTVAIHFPTSPGIHSYTTHWYGRNAYYSEYLPQSTTPVYLSNSFGVPSNSAGYQYANSGLAYAGVHTFVNNNNPLRSYIQVKLTDTLVSNKKYKVAFYVSLADSLHTSNNTIGAYFSADSFSVLTILPIYQSPQISNNNQNDLSSKTEWTLVCDTFVANGNERYITIGNFLTDSLSDTLYLGGGCYAPNGFNLCVAFYYIDDVSVTIIDETGIEEQKQNNFSLFPNPNKGSFYLQYKGIIAKPTMLYITDVYGKLIDTKEIVNTTTDYENTSLTSGLYFYSLRQGNEELGRGKFVVGK